MKTKFQYGDMVKYKEPILQTGGFAYAIVVSEPDKEALYRIHWLDDDGGKANEECVIAWHVVTFEKEFERV